MPMWKCGSGSCSSTMTRKAPNCAVTILAPPTTGENNYNELPLSDIANWSTVATLPAYRRPQSGNERFNNDVNIATRAVVFQVQRSSVTRELPANRALQYTENSVTHTFQVIEVRDYVDGSRVDIHAVEVVSA